MEFVHTSDWHLGRLFHQVSLLQDQKYLLDQLLQALKERPAAALVIAGDVYDRSVPPAEAVNLLDHFLDQVLSELKLPVLMIPGNHDSADRLGFAARHLHQAGLHIFSDLHSVDQPVCLEVDGQKVDFYGIPYADPQRVAELYADELGSDSRLDFNQAHTFLVERIKQNWNPAHKNVLISHCFLDGASESESERPLSIGGADRVDWQPLKDFDYVALGHLHAPQYKGAEWIRYSGSLMKYSFSEVNQSKGVVRVSLGEQATQTSLQELKPLRQLRILEGTLDELLEQGRTDPKADDYLLVRLEDRQALLNPMARLREVYPNLLHLERKKLLPEGANPRPRGEQLKRNELALFEDFFQQTRDESLTQAQQEVLKKVIEQARQEVQA